MDVLGWHGWLPVYMFLRPVFVLMTCLHVQKEIGRKRWGILSLVRVCPCLKYNIDAHHLARSEYFLYALTRLNVCWWSWYDGFQVFFSGFGGKLVLGLWDVRVAASYQVYYAISALNHVHVLNVVDLCYYIFMYTVVYRYSSEQMKVAWQQFYSIQQ